MKRPKKFLLGLAVILVTSPAFACSCMGPSEGHLVWLEKNASSSSSIVIARITNVSNAPFNSVGGFDLVDLEVNQSLKGSDDVRHVYTSICQNFPVQIGDTRIFFINADRVILGCTEYRYFLSDRAAISELKTILDVRKN